MTLILRPDGSVIAPDGKLVTDPEISAREVSVPHLSPHVIPFVMPRGEAIAIRAVYSSHCWTEHYDPAHHVPMPQIVRDGRQPRVFSRERYDDSKALTRCLASLAECKIYWTPSDRNYGMYNASAIVGGVAYTAFFTLAKERGRVNGVRYHVALNVESAYRARQPSVGTRLQAAAAIDAILNGKKLGRRR